MGECLSVGARDVREVDASAVLALSRSLWAEIGAPGRGIAATSHEAKGERFGVSAAAIAVGQSVSVRNGGVQGLGDLVQVEIRWIGVVTVDSGIHGRRDSEIAGHVGAVGHFVGSLALRNWVRKSLFITIGLIKNSGFRSSQLRYLAFEPWRRAYTIRAQHPGASRVRSLRGLSSAPR